MHSSRLVPVLAFVAAAAGLFGGCTALVGLKDVPGASDASGELEASSGDDAAGHPGSGSGDGSMGGPPGDGGAADAAAEAAVEEPDCSAPLTACSGQCVNVVTSGQNCGACSHACGNPADPDMSCTQGQCAPVVVMTDGPAIVGLGVDQGNVFTNVIYDGGNGGIDECAASACVIDHLLSSPLVLNSFNQRITTSGGILAVQSELGNEPLEWCTESNCTLQPLATSDLNTWTASGNLFASSIYGSRNDWINIVRIADGGTQAVTMAGGTGMGTSAADTPMALDDTNFVYEYFALDASAPTIAACTIAAGCADGNLTFISATIPSALDVFDGTVYMTQYGTPATGSSVSTCAVTGCATPTTLITNTAPDLIKQTAVDASGFYWLGSSGSIWRCKTGGCGHTGVTVTNVGAGDPPASMFVLSDGFVYFVNASDATKVYRIAEPL